VHSAGEEGASAGAAPSDLIATVPRSVDPVWQRIWLRAQSVSWTTLALIGASKRLPGALLDVAGGLSRVSEELGYPLVVLDARSLSLRDLPVMRARLRGYAGGSTRALVLCTWPHQNPVTVPVAQTADCALLCVFTGETKVVLARQSIEQVGRGRFLGTVVVSPEDLAHPF
jgi:hypothetical protein